LTNTRRPKQSREELRALMLSTGRTILYEEGLGTGAEALTFKRVFARVEAETGLHLTNGSIIGRVWPNQAEYQTDVLAMVGTDEGSYEIAETLAGLAPAIDAIDVSTEEARWHSLRQLCRLGGIANAAAMRHSTDWPAWIGVWALAANDLSSPERQGKIEAALLEGLEGITRQWEDIYTSLARELGFRFRDGLTPRAFTIAVTAVTEGCALRDRLDDSEMGGFVLPTGLHGENEDWTLFGIALEALAVRFVEIDPDWVAPESRVADVAE
jgi:hypothetical protein